MSKPKAKTIDKRHAKPTTAQLVERLYRSRLADNKRLENQLALIRLDLQALTCRWRESDDASAAVLADLAAEHDIIRERCDRQDIQIDRLIGLMQQFADRDRAMRRQVAEADRFMADPAKAHARWQVPSPLDVTFFGHTQTAAPTPLAAVPTLEITL